MTSQATFMGLPVELRVAIYDQLFEHNHDNVVVACCHYSHTATPRTEENVVWSSFDDQRLLITYVHTFAALHGTNKTIAAELDSFCFREWRLDFCAEHTIHTDCHFCGPLDFSPAGRCFLRSAASLPHLLEGMPIDICSLGKSIKHTTLHVRYDWFDVDRNHFDDDHDHACITQHWDCVDGIRNMVRVAGDKRPGTCFTVKFKIYDFSSEFDVAEFKKACLSILEQVPDHVDLAIDFDFEGMPYEPDTGPERMKAAKMFELVDDYFEKLQGPHRSEHFEKRDDLLMYAFYRLRDFTDLVFARSEQEDYAVWLNEPDQDEDCNSIEEWLTIAWEAREAGDPAQFEVAKKGLVDLWKKHHEACVAKLAEL